MRNNELIGGPKIIYKRRTVIGAKEDSLKCLEDFEIEISDLGGRAILSGDHRCLLFYIFGSLLEEESSFDALPKNHLVTNSRGYSLTNERLPLFDWLHYQLDVHESMQDLRAQLAVENNPLRVFAYMIGFRDIISKGL